MAMRSSFCAARTTPHTRATGPVTFAVPRAEAAVWVTVLALAACGGKTPTTPSEPTQSTFVVSGTVRDAGNLNFLSNAIRSSPIRDISTDDTS